MSGLFDEPARAHWYELTEAEKRAAVQNMADFGYGVYVIGSATGLSVETVTEILGGERE